MARARSGGSVKPKLNILAYGPTGAGKSSILLQMAYFKRRWYTLENSAYR